jgi:hypothetical protein
VLGMIKQAGLFWNLDKGLRVSSFVLAPSPEFCLANGGSKRPSTDNYGIVASVTHKCLACLHLESGFFLNCTIVTLFPWSLSYSSSSWTVGDLFADNNNKTFDD